MSMRSKQVEFETRGIAGTAACSGLAIAVAIVCLLAAGPALAKKKKGGDPRYCTSTALFQFAACENDVQDDFLTATAICINESDSEDREECFHDAYQESREAATLCREQRGARRDLCELLGEDRYDPDFDPEDFEETFTNLNEFYPIQSGNHWEYANEEETVVVDVTSSTKSIEGVTCIVVTDRVEVDGKVVEDTDDWFAQRKNGTIDYCGEISREFELFEGDVPDDPELVALEGSFKAGRDGAKPGTLFLGTPVEGRVYRQEWAPGDAEDAAEVLATNYGFGQGDPALDELVPQDLAEHLCSANDCIVTGEFGPLSPGDFERKYYARGIGLFLETNPESGEILQLVDCNVDPKCAALPTP
jgi:hypothetical protein